ncbi:MAG TPA: phospholipase A [Burkholderiales bacterium]|nr:phospholipase A [Burkholderiales bacterium]
MATLLALCLAGPATAEYLLVPENGKVAAGKAMSVTLFVPNESADTEKSIELPARLTLRTRGVAGAPDIVLKPDAGQGLRVTIKAGGFARMRYSGQLPRGLAGNVVLEPVDVDAAPLGISVTESRESTPASTGKDAPADNKAEAASNAVGPSDRDTARFTTAFSPYEPNYFSAGSDGVTNAKFQVSLKFRLFNPDTQTPFLEKLYLGYSQTSIWAIGSSSAPFYDSSYRPSFFFFDDDVSQWPWRKMSRLGFQAGVEHESNGKDGSASRSINIAFVRPTFTFPFADRYFFSVSPKVYTYLEKDDNPDIPTYRGYSDILLKIGETDGVQLASTLRKGTGSDPYSVELDLSIPLSTPRLGNLGGYLHLQFFDGWGESLLDYNRKVHPQFRIGLMITR